MAGKSAAGLPMRALVQLTSRYNPCKASPGFVKGLKGTRASLHARTPASGAMAPEILVATSTVQGWRVGLTPRRGSTTACLLACLRFAWIMNSQLPIGAEDGSKNNRWAEEFRRQGVDVQVWPDQVQDLAAVKMAVTLVQPPGVLQQVSCEVLEFVCCTRDDGGSASWQLNGRGPRGLAVPQGKTHGVLFGRSGTAHVHLAAAAVGDPHPHSLAHAHGRPHTRSCPTWRLCTAWAMASIT